MTKPAAKPIGRPRLFRLKPEVDDDLDYVTIAGNHASRTDALSMLVTREARRLRRSSTDALAQRVAERASRFPFSRTAGGARMDRAERLLRAYVEEHGGASRVNDDSPIWSVSTDRARVEATDDAVSALGDLDALAAVSALEQLGLGAVLRDGTRRYTAVVARGGALSLSSRRPR